MASDQTAARRERMRTLWIKTDRKIAEILIEEGLAGPVSRLADGRKKQLASMTRLVWLDREFWRKTWRKQKQQTSEDAHETRGEYVAVLDSYKEVGVDMLTDLSLKGTPRVQALMALTRIEEAKAKATGVAEVPPIDPDGGDSGLGVPFLGIVTGFANLTPAAQKKIEGWAAKKKDHGDGNGDGE